jgi:ABC-type nickel/cobalt efflux system permease component RcnA
MVTTKSLLTKALLVFVALLSLTTTLAISATHKVHVHGQAELTVAIDQHTIEVHLNAPAESLLGFEHQVQSEQEVAQVIALQKHVAQPDSVFNFDNKYCQIISQNIDTGDLLRSVQDHKHHTHDSHQSDHAEININYTYRCENTEHIKLARVQLFDHYRGLKQIRAMWITPNQQASVLLTPLNKEIIFK